MSRRGNKEVSALRGLAEDQGFTVRETTRNHLLFFKGAVFVCDLSGTPSSERELANKRAMLRRAGLIDPKKAMPKKEAR